MATLTPGELLGVLKEKNAQLLTHISAIFSTNSSPAPTDAQSSGNGVTGDQDMDDAWDEDDGGEPTWEDFPPGDVKHDEKAVGPRWQLCWPTHPHPLSHKPPAKQPAK